MCSPVSAFLYNVARSHNVAPIRGHTDFAESTEEIAPLTEAEKKARLEELRQRLKDKRANQAIVDREDQKKNEVRNTQDTRNGSMLFFFALHARLQAY